MGLNIGSIPVNGVNAVVNKVVGDFNDLSTLNREAATTYEICTLLNAIVSELVDKSAVNINYLEYLDSETASQYEIARALNKILLFLKAQNI